MADSPLNETTTMNESTIQDRPKRQSPDVGQFYQDIPLGLCGLDLEFRYLHINEWLAAINGIPVDEHLGRTFREVLPDLTSNIVSQLRHVIETVQPRLVATDEWLTAADPCEKRLFTDN